MCCCVYTCDHCRYYNIGFSRRMTYESAPVDVLQLASKMAKRTGIAERGDATIDFSDLHEVKNVCRQCYAKRRVIESECVRRLARQTVAAWHGMLERDLIENNGAVIYVE